MADTETTLAELRSQCYDVYKAQSDEARLYLPTVASQDINIAELNLPEVFQQNLGVSNEDLAGLDEMLRQANEFMAPYAQEAYLDLAQINIDLANCYIENGADAEALRAEAQATYDTIAAYDFLQAFSSTATGSPTVTVAPHSTKSVRVRAYCLDGGRSVPNVGEEYYLAGTLDQLQGEGLCQTIQSAQDFSAVSAAQGEIWSTSTALRPSSELDGVTESTTPTSDAQTETEGISSVELVQYAGLLPAIQADISNPVAAGVAVTGGVLTIISLLALVLHWGPKPLSIGGVLIGTGLIAGGIIVIATRTASATEIAQPSLYDAAKKNQVIVQATSTGSFTSLDVTITNLTDETLTLSTTCLRFVPKTISLDSDLAGSYDNYDYDIGDITSGEVDIEDLDESYDEAEYDEGHNAQRLGTGDVIDDDPPPLPPPPPEPDDTIDIEELKRKVEKQMDEARKKFEENPTEETLKDFLKEAQKCMALGCGDTDPMDGVGDAWQKAVDSALERYNNDPSDLNREQLERATEIGQMLGSNTDAAVGALLGQ